MNVKVYEQGMEPREYVSAADYEAMALRALEAESLLTQCLGVGFRILDCGCMECAAKNAPAYQLEQRISDHLKRPPAGR